MRMIEMCPRIFSNEIVSKGGSRWYGTLGYQGNTIHVWSANLHSNKINSQMMRLPYSIEVKTRKYLVNSVPVNRTALSW